jgi:glutamate synthase domain-containing protein 2
MNLQRPNSNDVSQTSNRSRDVVPCSGLCTRCMDGCRGNCEVFKSSFRAREVIYPGPFGVITAGGDKNYPIDYSHLNIQGYALGAFGLPKGTPADSDHAVFPAVDTTTRFGYKNKVTLKVPVFTGALGSTFIARDNWEHFAVGAAISGVSLICGENVCGVDPNHEMKNGKIVESPDLRRRVAQYREWQEEGFGDIHVQMNVEDTRFGVAEYAIGKLGVTTMELKWGQGAKCIGGEIKVSSLDRAIELQKRGYIVTPDPSLEANKIAFKAGAIKQFERHSRLGFVDYHGFMNEVERLRGLGAKRVTLKTGAYPARELAMAIRWGSDAMIDLLTIDGAPGGTGMSPWRMMEEWGVPTFYLQSMAYNFCKKLDENKMYVPDIAIGGGFSTEDHIFKVLAMGAPYTRAVCMGRALMIPGMVGKNIGIWMKNGDLPETVAQYGKTKEEIFVHYAELREKYGARMETMPLGAVGFYSFAQKLKVGLQQLMAGARKFNVPSIDRKDLMALTEEAAKISGISYVMDAYQEEAEKFLEV